MDTAIEEARRKVDLEVHRALDGVLPHLDYDEALGLLGDLRRLASWPRIVIRAFSFASDVVAAEPAASGAGVKPGSPDRTVTLVGGGHGPLLSVDEAVRGLDGVSEDVPLEMWAASELLGPKDLLVRLGVSRSTLHNWRRAGQVVALRKGLRNHVYPVRQFVGRAPIAGLAEVLARHAGPDEAWEWLVTPNEATNGQPPLDLLERGEIDQVKAAADSALDYA